MIVATLTMVDDVEVKLFFREEINLEAIADCDDVIGIVVDDCEDIDVVQCRIGLKSGKFILCFLPQADVSILSKQTECIVWCVEDDTLAKIERVSQEDDLNDRLAAAGSLITNHPNQDLKHRMVGEYLKRKAAYVAAVEALVQGMTNEQGS